MSNDWLYYGLQDLHSYAYQHADMVIDGMTITSIADFLLEVYMITTVDITDVHVIERQANNLDDIYTEGVQLHQQLDASFERLRPLWTGHHADAYLPPMKTAFAIEHDIAPTTTGDILSYNMGMVVQTFQHNATVHHAWKSHTNALYDVKVDIENILGEIVGSQVITLILQAAPVADVIALAADAIGMGWLVKRLRDAWNTWNTLLRLIAVVTALVAVAGIIWLEHELEVWIVAALATATAGSYDWRTPDGTALPDDLKEKADELFNKFGDALKNLGLTEELARQLIAFIAVTIASYCTASEADAITQSIIDSLPNNDLLSMVKDLKQKTAALGFQRILYIAVTKLAQQCTVTFEQFFVGASGQPRGIDVVAKKDGIIYFAESGGNSKGSKKGFPDFKSQLRDLIAEARKQGAIPQFYIETPDGTSPSLDQINITPPKTSWDNFYRAKMYAEYVLGAGNVFVIPNGTTACQAATTIENPNIPIPSDWNN